MKRSKTITIPMIILALLGSVDLSAQRILSLEDCHEMAVSSNKDMEAAQLKMQMAGLDKKIAVANWLPDISVKGGYMYNEKSVSLVGSDLSDRLQNAGTMAQDGMNGIMQQLTGSILSNPAAMKEFMSSPMWQTVAGTLSKVDLAGMINQIGSEIDGAMHPDLHNVVLGVASLQQPVFMGGKIAAASKIAALAEELSRVQYEQQYQDVLVAVDQSYWQIVSISNKLKLAEAYSDLLSKLLNDVEISIGAGVMTDSDLLQIQVKSNEADMMKLKAENGLSLSKMLLCKQIGLPLDSDIRLEDENLEEIPLPDLLMHREMENIYADRPEIRSLELASQIYDKKVNVIRADMMPHVAVTANYLLTYPDVFHGFKSSCGGTFNVGVMVNIPIFHACQQMNRTRKAKTEAALYRTRMEDAKSMVSLQVSQLRKQQDESLQRLEMAKNNLRNAEENMRTASVGFEAGVVPTNTALAAHTAWLEAHSACIDAGVELQMNNSRLMKAEGAYVVNVPEVEYSKNKNRKNK